VFALPSRGEGFGLVFLEAMAYGRAVVGGAHGGTLDIIEDGVTGLLVLPRDAEGLARQVTMLLNDPGLCERLGRAAQRKAREITWDRIAKQTIETYKKIL